MSGLSEAGWGGEGPYRDGKLHVCNEMCPTCVFRPGNLMMLRPGALKKIVDENIANGAAITCHATLPEDERAVCRGFFDRYPTAPLVLAQAMDVVEFVDPPEKEDA